MFPWAIKCCRIRISWFDKMFIFMGLLFAGLIYIYKKRLVFTMGLELKSLGDS